MVTLRGGGEKVGKNWTELVTLFEGLLGESGKNLTELVTLSEGGGEKVGKNWTELVTLFEGWLGEREELESTGYPI